MSLDEMLSRRPNPAGVVRNLDARPIEKVAIVTCMDARIAAFSVFGLRIGDAHIIRNAGAAVTNDVIRSLAISQRKLGTRNILLMAHTGCGMLSFTDDEFIAELAQDTGQPPTWRPGTFSDPVQHVRHGMEMLRTSPFLHPDTNIRGYVFNLETGAVDEVTEDEAVLAAAAQTSGKAPAKAAANGAADK
ncbi:MAG TPA: carbonic anhydrase [Pseudonocardia sp.]|nr:carbonic anhydrase [Pseudonocardia sp.]